MFDKQKVKELQQRSHTRGLLSKEIFFNEKQELERKRREMKNQLDRQVEERRRQKEQQKLQNERRLKRQEEEIKNYYKNIEGREKRPSGNQSSVQKNMKNSIAPYQTYPNDSQHESGVKLGLKDKNRNSKPFIPIEAQIPLMPLMPDYPTNNFNSQQTQGIANSKVNTNLVNPGAIPLLDLSEEQNIAGGAKTKKGKQKTKRQRTLQAQRESQTQKIQQQSRQQLLQPIQPASHERWGSNNQRKSTLPDQENIVGSIVRAAGNSLQKRGNDSEYIHEQIEQIQQQNRALKMELKKSQQAVSLLIGAVRSNGKLDKYRMQAEKILTGNLQGSIVSRKQEEAKEQNALMLPKINLRNQSIMHDYIISAALRAKKGFNK